MHRPYLRSEGLCAPTPHFENVYIIICNSSSWEICLSSPSYLLIRSFIYTSMDSWIFILYLSYIIQYYHKYYCILLLKLFQLWSLGAFSFGPYVSLIYPKHCGFVLFCFLSISLLSGNIRCSRFALYISCFSTRISHFSKECWFLLLENGIRSQDLGNNCNHSTGVSCF